MTPLQLRRLAIALGAAAALWIVLAIVRKPVRDREARMSLASVDTAAVDTVFLKRGSDSSLLVRTSPTEWKVNGLPTSSAAVASLLAALRDSTATTELVAQNATSHQRFEVTTDSGMQVRIAAKGEKVLDLVAGKKTSSISGIYLRRSNEDAVYTLSGSLANELNASAEHWRDKRIAAIEPDSVALIEVRRGTANYLLRKTDSTWKFSNGRAASTDAVSSLLGQYQNLSAAGFATAQQADSINFARSRRSAKLSGKSGQQLVSILFDSTASGVWAKLDTGNTIFRIEAWTFGNLAPAESTLRARTGG